MDVWEKRKLRAQISFYCVGGRARQDGLGSDYTASPKLKFDGTSDNLVIAYNASAVELTYAIKGIFLINGKKVVVK